MIQRKGMILFLSSGFRLGYLPFAPGTFGTLPGLPICWLLSKLDTTVSFLLIVVSIPLAVWLADEAEKILDKKDPGTVVIDEIAGMVITLAGLPFNFVTAMLGFTLFRIFDITKPYPIRFLDRKLRGGIGIVLDDIMAGIFANITLRIIIKLIDIK